MQLTTEQRQLLEGDAQRAQRNQPLMGWSDASTAPDWAKERILEIRSAIVEKRSVPAPSGRFIAAAERRSLTAIGKTAVDFGRKLFRAPQLTPNAAQRAEALRTDPNWQAVVAQAHRTQAALLKKEEERQAQAVRDAEEIAQINLEIFPWESRG